MAELNRAAQEPKEAVTPDIGKPEPATLDESKQAVFTLNKVWWPILAVGAFFAVLGLFAVGSATLHKACVNDESYHTTRGASGMMHRGNQGMGGVSMMGQREDIDDMADRADQGRVRGVVTAVNGSTITVAGNGTTTEVVVTDDTIYMGDDKPAAVNDTIMAVGTKQGDTFTATRVALQRQ